MATVMATLPPGLGTIDQTLITELQGIANSDNPQEDPVGNPRAVHACVLFFKGRAPQLFVRRGDKLNEVPIDGEYPPVPNVEIKRLDYFSALFYLKADGVDPTWYTVGGKRYHTP
jgi:hypothetical protein